jgi:DtxR family transcriptional regulator, Mn-dependent transcriptional regulator
VAERPVHQRSLSPAVEDYAKAIYHLEQSLGEPVSTAALAERLGVRPASVSGMLRKLDDLGYLDYLPYHGVRLSSTGRRAALEVIRRHRLLELFLYEILGVTWDQVHDEAEALEHALSPKLCDLIATRLGDPRVDPHGDPIPSRDGVLVDAHHERLSSVSVGTTVQLARVSDRDPEVLRLLSSFGIGLGGVVSVVARTAAGDVSIRVDDLRHVLPASVVSAMLVDPLP